MDPNEDNKYLPFLDAMESLQGEINEWQKRNFPGGAPWEPLLGLQEELGELSHAWLKRHQGIRMTEPHTANIHDAVGDVFIYLVDFCMREGIQVGPVIVTAWIEVQARDWAKHRKEHKP